MLRGLCFILWQIENEYGPLENEFGAAGKAYTKWAAEMAVGLGTGVPWVMCKQDDAPDPVVSVLWFVLLMYTVHLWGFHLIVYSVAF